MKQILSLKLFALSLMIWAFAAHTAMAESVYVMNLANNTALGNSATYGAKSGTVSGVTWYVNAASYQSSNAPIGLWLGTNNNNSPGYNYSTYTKLDAGLNGRGDAIAAALGTTTTTVGYYAIAGMNNILNVGSVTAEAAGVNGTVASMWCLYTTDNGTTYTILDVAKPNPTANLITFTAPSAIASAQYAFVWYSSAASTYRSPKFEFFAPTTSTPQVATPTFSIPAGTYTSPQSVTISTTTTGATIYYTIDGTTPTISTGLTAMPISVSTTTTIKAFAVKEGMEDSDVAIATYTITAPPSIPNIVISGVYGGGGNSGAPFKNDYIELYNTTNSPIDLIGYTLYYTSANGTNVSSANTHTFVSGELVIGAKKFALLKAAAGTTVTTPWPIVFDFDLSNDATTIFSMAATSGKILLLNATTDLTATNSIPTTLANIQAMTGYVDFVPFGATNIPAAQVFGSTFADLSATFAGKRKYNDATKEIAYTFNVGVDFERVTVTATTPRNSSYGSPTVATPTFDIPAGTYYAVQNVTISCEAGATIHYTTNGATPTTDDPTYSTPIPISTTTTIKAIAVKAGMNNSAVATAEYIIVLTPTVTTTPATTLNFAIVSIEETASLIVNVKGTNLTENLTVNITGNGFSSTTTSITKENAMTSGGYNVTVNFAPGLPQFYSGTLTISSSDISDITINLKGTGAVPEQVPLMAWDFTGRGANPDTLRTFAATTYNANLTPVASFKDITRGPGAPWSTGSNSFRTTGFKDTPISVSNTAYFQVTVKPDAGKAVSLSSISGLCNGTAGYAADPGVSSQFAYSLDGNTFTLIGSPSIKIGITDHTFDFDLSSVAGLQNVTGTIYLRYYASGQTTTGGWGFNSFPAETNGLSIFGSIKGANQVAKPTFTPSAGTYYAAKNVTINGETGATIHYTTNNATPTTSDPIYSTPIPISTTTTIKAIAVKAGMDNSEIATAKYTIILTPVVITTPATTLNFANVNVEETKPLTLNVKGSHLTENLTVNITGSGFSSTTTSITKEEAMTSGGYDVTVNFAPGLPQPYSGTLTISSSEISDITINLTGTGVVPPPTPIIAWDFTGANNVATFAATTYNANLTPETSSKNITRGPGAPASSGNNSFRTQGFKNTPISVSNTAYFQVTVKPADGKAVSLSSISGLCNGTDTYAADPGVSSQFAYSLDETTFTLIGEPFVKVGNTNHTFEFNVSSVAELQNVTGTIYLRYYASGQTTTGGWGFNSYPAGTNGLAIFGSIKESNQVATPTFTPPAGNYTTTQHVAISSTTQNTIIYYTTDGTVPTESSAVYSTPIPVSATTTIKALATKAGMDNSIIATAIYSFPIEVTNIAAFKAANTPTATTNTYKITGDVTFVFRGGNNIYIKDASAGLVIFDNTSVITKTYNEGDVISGGVMGTCEIFNGLYQLKPKADLAAGTSGAPVQPTILTMANLLANFAQYESQLVKLEKVTFAAGTFETGANGNIEIYQNSSKMICRNHYGNITGYTTKPESQFNVTGLVIPYNTEKQIAPRKLQDIEDYYSIVENSGAIINIFSYNKGVAIINENLVPLKQVEIMDMYGRVIWKGQANNTKTEIMLNVATGIYAVRIITGDNQHITTKIVIN